MTFVVNGEKWPPIQFLQRLFSLKLSFMRLISFQPSLFSRHVCLFSIQQELFSFRLSAGVFPSGTFQIMLKLSN